MKHDLREIDLPFQNPFSILNGSNINETSGYAPLGRDGNAFSILNGSNINETSAVMLMPPGAPSLSVSSTDRISMKPVKRGA